MWNLCQTTTWTLILTLNDPHDAYTDPNLPSRCILNILRAVIVTIIRNYFGVWAQFSSLFESENLKCLPFS